MGVIWGIVRYGDGDDRELAIAEWSPLAKLCRRAAGFSMMCGDERLDFRRERTEGGYEAVVTSVRDAETRAKIDALSCGDGTYDLFEQLFDGYELFVPWRPSKSQMDGALGSPAHGLHSESVESLSDWMWHKKWYPPEDPDLRRLALDLLDAAELARKQRMLLRIWF